MYYDYSSLINAVNNLNATMLAFRSLFVAISVIALALVLFNNKKGK